MVTTVPEVRLTGGVGDLRHHVLENRFAGGERNRSLDLDFQNGGAAAMILGFDDYIIERVALGGTLELVACDCRAGKPARLRAHEHGRQIVRTNLALELAAGWSAGGWALGVGRHEPPVFREIDIARCNSPPSQKGRLNLAINHRGTIS